MAARDFIKRFFLPFFSIIAFLLLWQLASAVFKIPEWLIPSPRTIILTLIEESAEISKNLLVTLLEAFGGFVLGNGFAIIAAIAFVHSPSIERTGYPFVLAIRSVPIVAITPILVLALGNGWEPKVAIAALISFFPTLVNMVKGFRSVDASAIELMHVLNATNLKVFTKLRVPSSLPYFFSAMKIAASSSILGAIVAEWIGSSTGLGYLIIISTFQFRADLLYATMFVSALASVLAFITVGVFERVFIRWEREIEI